MKSYISKYIKIWFSEHSKVVISRDRMYDFLQIPKSVSTKLFPQSAVQKEKTTQILQLAIKIGIENWKRKWK